MTAISFFRIIKTENLTDTYLDMDICVTDLGFRNKTLNFD